MLIDFTSTHLYIGLIALETVLIVLWWQNKGFSYLFFFGVFWIYLMSVVSVVVFPIHVPDGSTEFIRTVQLNLVPFRFGRCDFLFLCIRNIYQNILLTVPFGFGISFIAQIKPGNIYWLALAVGLVFEVTQLVIALVVRSSFRVVDINDVLLNALGVLLGYGIFRIFGWLYSVVIQKSQIQPRYVFAYIYDIVRRQN